MSRDITEDIKKTFIEVVPEKKKKINKLFLDYQLNFQITDNMNNSYIEECPYFIKLSNKTAFLIYLSTKLFYKLSICNAGNILEQALTNSTFKFDINNDEYSYIQEVNSWEGISFEEKIKASRLHSVFNEMFNQPHSIEERGIRDLFFMSLSFMLLHEVGHKIFNTDDEMMCDKYAIDFITDKIDLYKCKNNETPKAILNKRLSSILLGYFAIAVRENMNVFTNNSHPVFGKRIEPLIEYAKKSLSFNVDKLRKTLSDYIKNKENINENRIKTLISNNCKEYFWPMLTVSIYFLSKQKGININTQLSIIDFCISNYTLI